MFEKQGKRLLGLLLSASILISGNLTLTAAGVGTDVEETSVSLIETEERRNFSVPSEDKHAYNPFATLEDEEVTEAYREQAEYSEDTIIYKQTETKGWFRSSLRPETDENALSEIGIQVDDAKELNREKTKSGFFSDTYELTYEAKLDGDVWETVDKLSEMDGIVDAQPDYIYHTTAVGVPDTTTDPELGRQWYTSDLHMQEIWQDFAADGITPGEETVVAVIDTGVDYTHPDLIPNMWVNTAELNGRPGVDDDGNGYVDDIYGVSTVGSSYYHSGDPMDDHGHGTHVAGIIAMAAGNREGGAGLAYGTKIMAIKAGQATGTFADTDIAEAIRYAVANGADVINMSFGGYGHSFLVEEALQDAFGSCVLVASAGNDGIPTSDAPAEFLKKADTYPAGYSYVLGVMATDQNGKLASFSNWDYYGNINAEYEIAAPGVDIFSTLPGGQYAPWSGTSMAAPMVSAAAALLRTKYFDKSVYSSRFIMGQLASATNDTVTYVDKIGEPHTYAALNIKDSIDNLPKPNLTAKSTYLFDGEDIAAGNDNDGIVDAGETIDLGLVLRNQWGLATDITVTADAKSDGGVENPNVEFITDSITMDDIGTFNEQDNDFRYDGDYLEGTDNPIRFRIKDDTINDAHIPINIHVSARNGFDPEDQSVYYFDFTITFYVQRGRVLKGRITEDMTLTKEDYWIIENSLLIPEGVTVNVEPGTQIQFWSSEPEGPYAQKAVVYIRATGEFLVNGTEEEPVEMFPSIPFQNFAVTIWDNASISYANILNPILVINKADHLNATQSYGAIYQRTLLNGSVRQETGGGSVFADQLNDSVLTNLNGTTVVKGQMNTVFFDNCSLGMDVTGYNYQFTNCTILSRKGSTIRNIGNWLYPNHQPKYTSIYSDNGHKYVGVYWEEDYPDTTNQDARWKFLNRWAEAKGGTLLCLNFEEEFQTLNDFLSENPFGIQTSSNIWVTMGLYADTDTGELHWVDGNDSYFPSGWKAGANGTNSFYPYGDIWICSDRLNISSDQTSSSVYKYALLEFPDTVSDETITAAMTAEEYFALYPQEEYIFSHNAILNQLNNFDTTMWQKFQVRGADASVLLTNNYWGTEDERLIQSQITDFDDYVDLADIIHTPWLTLDSPELEDIYPFVTKAYVADTEGNPLETVGFQNVQIHVEFNRDMAADVQPMVSYGPDEPYTDYVVNGDWVTPRHWVGETSIKPIIDAGTEYIRVKGAAAADDKWLTTGTDWGRFAFTISNTGVQAMNLQGEGKEDAVALSWTQTDYDTLAGYNVYRSDKEDGSFSKINTRLVPGTIREFTDYDVEPGKDYYYYFTVVGTDMSESQPSNTVKATPIDNIRPTLQHTRVTECKYGESLSFSAVATDNVGIEYVKVFYRAAGTESWSSVTLSAGENNRYFGVIPASEISRDGMEYYIEASDGISFARDGSAQVPISVAVNSTAVIYSVSPSYVDTLKAAEGITALLTGVNFTDDMTLLVGGKETDYTFISDKQLSFTVPANSIGRVDISLCRSGETAAVLTNAITYNDSHSEVQILGGNVKARESVRLPVMVTADGELLGVELQFKVDRTFFTNIAFEKAEEASGAIADFSVDYSGNVKVSLASATPVPTGGAIGYLVLTAADRSSTAKTAVQLVSAALNNVDAAFLVDGSVTVEPNFNVGGRITYYKDGSPLKGVTVRLSNGMSTVTDEDGRYTFTGVSTGNITVTPEFSGSVNDAVTAYDASLVLKAVVGTTDLSEDQLIAADVDGDGEVSPMDASYILQKSVEMIDGAYPGSGAEWIFNPSGRTINPAGNNTGLDFTAYLLGDVNGDWKSAE